MLFDELRAYAAGGVYPMHMPGHKRNAGFLPPGLPYEIDITEIHGFDDLHDPHSLLMETAGVAAGLYGSDKAFPLINGSTVGILAAIGAHAGRGDKVLVAGNCHRSVQNAVALFGAEPVYIEPDEDEDSGIACSINPATVESMLVSNPDVRLVVVTSPSYEGVVSDIGSIAAIAHKRNIPIFVDSAHGAHLGFSGFFPDSAVHEGADVVVMSLHKTLPALTQCSLLHVCGERADLGELSRLLSVLQTSSPSYVLMASIDSCLRLLADDKDSLFYEYERNLERFYVEAKALENLCILGQVGQGDGSRVPMWDTRTVPLSQTVPLSHFAFDPGKIVIVTKKAAISGDRLMSILREEFLIELELARPNYAIAMTSICDTAEGFDRLIKALVSIDRFFR